MNTGLGPAEPGALRAHLESLAEPAYRAFSSALIPGLGAQEMLGVRLPALRSIARTLARGDWRAYLSAASDASFEEIMLQGMVIGAAKTDAEETLSLVSRFVPKITNWSVCDSFCAGLVLARAEPARVWEFIVPYAEDAREYHARFGIVMLLMYYIDADHIDRVLSLIASLKSTAFYAEMAAAWALSQCCVAFPAQTQPVIGACLPTRRAATLALQKVVESNRAGAEMKAWAREKKRALRAAGMERSRN